MKIVLPDESFTIMGACFEVYREKGCGFLEAVYQECLEIEFNDRMIPCRSHPVLTLSYKDHLLRNKYTPDFVCYDKIIVELKAVGCLSDEHRAQVQNYLRGTGMKLGLLINFGHYPKLRYERILL